MGLVFQGEPVLLHALFDFASFYRGEVRLVLAPLEWYQLLPELRLQGSEDNNTSLTSWFRGPCPLKLADMAGRLPPQAAYWRS